MSNGAQPVIKLDKKHPTNSAGIASGKISASIVSASDSLICTAPLAKGAITKEVAVYSPAIKPARVRRLVNLELDIKKSLRSDGIFYADEKIEKVLTRSVVL